MKHIPSWFSDRLRNYDRSLRVRWSLEKHKYVIEAKVLGNDRRFLLRPIKLVNGEQIVLPRDSDVSICYHDGYYPILSCSKLTNQVFYDLVDRDLKKFKYSDDLQKHVLNKDIEQEDSHSRAISNSMEGLHNEVYDTIQRKLGNRTVGTSSPCSNSNWS